ncbi:MAG: type I glyceraldehyde-3-phosphate dehydrogenase, partial [Ignavibacteriales bacterium]|nr:type I glyceraldehyde-3-phosphate dehydrogenase [Ignavibacteriales bacterium]
MAIKVGINGFGRIGRLVLKRAMQVGGYDFVGINDLTDAATLAHLLKYDSVHGRFPGEVKVDGNDIIVNGDRITISAEKDPANLKWKDLGAEIIVEATGVFRSQEACMKHIEAGAKKVILTVPSKGEVDATIVLGVNDNTLKGDEKVIS